MVTGWVLLAIGLFIIFGVVIFNIGMNSNRAQRMVNLIGIGGTKIVYGILGIAITVLGILYLTA